jgi:hypothetical protein
MSANWLRLIGLLAIWPVPIQAHDIYSHLVDDLIGLDTEERRLTTEHMPDPVCLRAALARASQTTGDADDRLLQKP